MAKHQKTAETVFNIISCCHKNPCLPLSSSEGDSRDGAMLPVPEYQTKVPLYGRDHISSRKVQAMKQAKDRKKQLARLGPTSNLDFTPPSLDKLEPEFVSERGDLSSLIEFPRNLPNQMNGRLL